MCSGNTKVVSKIVKSQFLELADLLTVNLQAVKQEPQMSIFPIHMSLFHIIYCCFIFLLSFMLIIQILLKLKTERIPMWGPKRKRKTEGPLLAVKSVQHAVKS